MDEGHLALRKLAVLKVFANDVAEYSAEILMTRIGEEASGVCKHADEPAEKSES